MLVALAIAVPASAKDAEPASGAAATAAPAVQIENFGRINDNYFRGAQPVRPGATSTALAALGVKTIIDLQRDDYDPNEGKRAR